MSSKFYVWTGGRWCEVCPVTGRVKGSEWRGKARFVFVRKGRLCIARSQRVLRGLQALAAGQPTTVQDDAKLKKLRKKRLQRAHCSGCRHSGCPARDHSAQGNNAKIAQETSLVDVAVQSGPGIEVATAHPKPTAAKQLRIPSPTGTRSSIDEFNEHYRELIIDETDVDLYRSYLIKHQPSFDLLRFDTDVDYKLRVFYKINPLVSIEKCKQIEGMLRASPCSQDTLSLKDFATKLGLQSISDQEMERSKSHRMRLRKKEVTDDTDKENRLQNNQSKSSTENNAKKKLLEAVRRNIGKDNKQEARKKQESQTTTVTEPSIEPEKTSDRIIATKAPPIRVYPIKFKSSKSHRVFNGYSNLEDHAIVAWVSGGRSRFVNGNRIWRDLEKQFPNLTGVERTFHSLRNRYLRHILPSLQNLALPPKEAARLRADAAAGEIKSRKNTEPYPFEYPRVVSAWGVRDKDKDHSPTDDSETQIDKDINARERRQSRRDLSKSQQSLNSSQSKDKNKTSQKSNAQSKKVIDARDKSPPKSKKQSLGPSPGKKLPVSRNESPFRADKQSSSSKNPKNNKSKPSSKTQNQSRTSNEKSKSSRNASPVRSRQSPTPSHNKKKRISSRMESPSRSRHQSPIPSTSNDKSSSNKHVSTIRYRKQSPVKSHSRKKSMYNRIKSRSTSRDQSPVPSTSNNNSSNNRHASPIRSRKQSPVKSHSKKSSMYNRIKSPSTSRDQSPVPSTSNEKSSNNKHVSSITSHSKKKSTHNRVESPSKSLNQSPAPSTRNKNQSANRAHELSPNKYQSKHKSNTRNESPSPIRESRKPRNKSSSQSPARKPRSPRKSRNYREESSESSTSDSLQSFQDVSRDRLLRSSLRNRSMPDINFSRESSPLSRSLRDPVRETRQSPSLLRFQNGPPSPPPLQRNKRGRFVKRSSTQKRRRSSSSSAVREVKRRATRAVSISSDSSDYFEVKREADRSSERALRNRSIATTSKVARAEGGPTTPDKHRPRTRKLYNHNVRPH